MEQVHKFNDATPLTPTSPRHAKLFNILQSQNAPADAGELRDVRKKGFSMSDHEITSFQQRAIDSFARPG